MSRSHLAAKHVVYLKMHTDLGRHSRYKPQRDLHESPTCMRMGTQKCAPKDMHEAEKLVLTVDMY